MAITVEKSIAYKEKQDQKRVAKSQAQSNKSVNERNGVNEDKPKTNWKKIGIIAGVAALAFLAIRYFGKKNKGLNGNVGESQSIPIQN